MTWYAHDRALRKTTIRKGAVPLGQHHHHPDEVLGPVAPPPPSPGPPVDAPIVHPLTGAYVDLPRPAVGARGCCRCDRGAALVDPTSHNAYCADCWVTDVIQAQLD